MVIEIYNQRNAKSYSNRSCFAIVRIKVWLASCNITVCSTDTYIKQGVS